MAKKQRIVRVQEDGWVGLNYDNERFYKDTLPLGNPTGEEYADLCDREAENANQHDFCGVHARLLEILQRRAGPIVARKVMKEIAEAGGLWELED